MNDINDILKILNDIIEVYRDCTVKNENMCLDFRLDEKDIEKLELFVYEFENNDYCKRLVDADLRILQENLKNERGD